MDRNGGTSEATGTQFIENKTEFPSLQWELFVFGRDSLVFSIDPPKKTLENFANSTVDPRVFLVW